MSDHETFHHELSTSEYAVLIDAQFAVIASVLPIDAFKNNVPTNVPEALRELWWCDDAGKHIALQAEHMGTYHIGSPQPDLYGDTPKDQPRMRKVVQLLAHVTGENVDDGFFQDAQLVGTGDGGHAYALFEPTTAEHLTKCALSADEILRAVDKVAKEYVEFVTHGTQVGAFTPQQADHELAS